MKIPLLKDTFMEMIEIQWDNILYPYVCTDSRSLVNVSPMRIELVYHFVLPTALYALYAVIMIIVYKQL